MALPGHGTPEGTSKQLLQHPASPSAPSPPSGNILRRFPPQQLPRDHQTLAFPYPPRHGSTSACDAARQTIAHKLAPSAAIARHASTPALLDGPPGKRKPLSLAAASFRSLPYHNSLLLSAELSKPDQRFARPLSIDSPTLYNFAESHVISPALSSPALSPGPSPAVSAVRDLYESHDEVTPIEAGTPETRGFPLDCDEPHRDAPEELSDVLSEYDDLISQGPDSVAETAQGETPSNVEDDSPDANDTDLRFDADNSNNNLLPPPMFAPRPVPPHLRLQKVDTSLIHQRPSISDLNSPDSAALSKTLSKSPSQATPSPFTSLFGWANSSPSVTDCSSVPSPISPTRKLSADDAHRVANPYSHPSPANAAAANPINYCESFLSTPPPSQHPSLAQVEEMEDELKAISSELAASIRREMDLEDLVDRLQDQVSNPQAPNKRTSDYFSDSGYSSAKLSDSEQSREEIEKVQRRAEQEKASIRLELTTKLQDERFKRKALDEQIKELAEKASEMDLASINSLDASGRVKELENTCEDLRRRLSEERDSKNNFEDLLSALKGELRDACNERDNLRDEVVPQLRARVEGLEAEAAAYADLTYESTKMQQQLQSLQEENTSLRNSPAPAADEVSSLARSNSVTAGPFRPRMHIPTSGLSRSGSVKNAQTESRDQLAERLKDVEAQRDALHSALKNLLERQEFQNRENQKKIEALEEERTRLLTESPRKAGFERDIANLRTEINVLRRRAEDALEQKWQVEKGLVGLKMDLDRAEEEIASLRSLLSEKDILIPPSLARSSFPDGSTTAQITSDSLEKAYRELQDAYKQSLERIKKLEAEAGTPVSDEKTKLAMERLEQSLSSAVLERDAALQHASSLKVQVDGLIEVESKSVGRERELADELSESAQRVESLAAEVRQQLSRNSELRDRLSEAVLRGDAERKSNSERISGMQKRLHILEEKLVAAQSSSEDRVGRHEDEISRLREAHNEQLRRLNNGPGNRMSSGPRSPLLPRGSSRVLSPTHPIPAKSFEDETRIKELRERVTELEKALADADNEIQQVVAKMSEAQIEVMNLQEERETALRETKRLQRVIADEQSKSFEDRFKTLTGMAAA
ncbi:hypothetical protein HIM_02439 [Hirsutella minnesotensis 3608]|nr:hypothetical protein HIM_02439 [Hirsutella minnesotensis 3608]